MNQYNFKTVAQVTEAIKICRKTSAGRAMIPIPLKVAIIKFQRTKWKQSVAKFCDRINVQQSGYYGWIKHYDNGRFDPSATYSVSITAKAASTNILKTLQGQLAQTQKQIELVKKCEANGLKVILAA